MLLGGECTAHACDGSAGEATGLSSRRMKQQEKHATVAREADSMALKTASCTAASYLRSRRASSSATDADRVAARRENDAATYANVHAGPKSTRKT
eukprot:1457401-Pleurochrysis_carterae.AAC.2